MKQPDLGKKIAELRKTRRLTQEELVEMCNISVRTIQRIESGEVTPRDYTLKSIFSALDYDLEQVVSDADHEARNQPEATNGIPLDIAGVDLRVTKWLTLAAGAGILYFISRFFEGAAEYSRFGGAGFMPDWAYITIKITVLGSFILFMRGFVVLGKLFQNGLLRRVASIYIGVNAVVLAMDALSLLVPAIPDEPVLMTLCAAYGAMGLLFGYALRRMPAYLGKIPRVAGLIEIIAGCVSLTIVFGFLNPLVLIPAEILEILLLYKCVDWIQLSKRSTP